MHAVVVESLEEYLAGTLEPAERRDIDAHLAACQSCREEIGEMQEISQLFVSMKSEETWEASPGFYAGVLRQVEERQPAPSLSGMLAFNFGFGRRLVFASLLTLAVLGSYLITREADYTPGPSPDAILAQQNSPNFDTAPARDNMLVTLTAYEQR